MNAFHYGQDHLTAAIAYAISEGKQQGLINDESRAKIRQSAAYVEQIVAKGKAVYGINTGFGPLCTTMISEEQTRLLQENILKSHAVGLGDPIDRKIAKLMLILKLQALAQGFSGVQEATLDRILLHIDQDAIPVVPSQGSVGASGDLAPLSHLFLPLIGLGKLDVKGQKVDAADWLAANDLAPVTLGPKEGLGLINGTQFIAAHAVEVVVRMQSLLTQADMSGALMLEGLQGSEKPFAAELHELRPYKGNQHVAERMRHLLKDSEVMQAHKNCSRVQDPYSLRCMPQVHGSSRNAWLHLKELLEIELNAVTDNPVVFSAEHTISGGNFHGQPLAMALDYACLAAAELGNIADRRIYLSLEGDVEDVPKLLVKDTGVNSGFMIPQYTTAALVSENKSLCFPASADSVPTSLGQEDHVSMGSISGRKALQVIGNVEKIIGVEFFCAAQALDFHAPLQSSKIVMAIHAHIRQHIDHVAEDRIMYNDMEKAVELVQSNVFIDIAKATAKEHALAWDTAHSALFDQC